MVSELTASTLAIPQIDTLIKKIDDLQAHFLLQSAKNADTIQKTSFDSAVGVKRNNDFRFFKIIFYSISIIYIYIYKILRVIIILFCYYFSTEYVPAVKKYRKTSHSKVQIILSRMTLSDLIFKWFNHKLYLPDTDTILQGDRDQYRMMAKLICISFYFFEKNTKITNPPEFDQNEWSTALVSAAKFAEAKISKLIFERLGLDSLYVQNIYKNVIKILTQDNSIDNIAATKFPIVFEDGVEDLSDAKTKGNYFFGSLSKISKEFKSLPT